MRPTLTRLLIFAIPLTLGLVLYRVVQGPEVPDGFFVRSELPGDALLHGRFQLDAPATLVVRAVGSFGINDSLEAFPWILDARTRRPVWKMQASQARRKGASLALVTDILAGAAIVVRLDEAAAQSLEEACSSVAVPILDARAIFGALEESSAVQVATLIKTALDGDGSGIG